MSLVELPRTCTHQALIGAIDQVGFALAAAEMLALHLPEGCFVTPCAMALLGAWGLHLREKGIRLSVVGNDDARRYLSRMDVFRTLDLAFTENFERHNEAGRFVPMKQIEGESCKPAVDAVCDLVLHQFDNAREFLPALEWAVMEITDNILIHAQSQTPGVLCAQYFPERQRLDVGLCDMGRGLMSSLSESHSIRSHGDAIRKALQRGVTRDKVNCMGNGLAGTLEIAKVNGGSFQIWTGDVTFRLQDGQDKGFIPHATVPGTGLLLSLRTDRPVNLRETFIEDASWTYIDAEAQRIACTGGLRILDECVHTGSRPSATGLRRKILTIFPDLEGPLVLDFDGVSTASSSFLDELLGRLAEELGADAFRSSIHLVNASRHIRGLTEVVLKQRLEDGSVGDRNEVSSSPIASFAWKPDMPVLVCGVLDGQITPNGIGFQEFGSLAEAREIFPDLDPEVSTERFTHAMVGNKHGVPRLRVETWSAYRLYST